MRLGIPRGVENGVTQVGVEQVGAAQQATDLTGYRKWAEVSTLDPYVIASHLLSFRNLIPTHATKIDYPAWSVGLKMAAIPRFHKSAKNGLPGQKEAILLEA